MLFVKKALRWLEFKCLHFLRQGFPCNPYSRHHVCTPFDSLYGRSISSCVNQLVSHISFHSKIHAQIQNYPLYRQSSHTCQTKLFSIDQIDSIDQLEPNLCKNENCQFTIQILKIRFFNWKEKPMNIFMLKPFLCRNFIAVFITRVSSTALMKSSFSRSSFDVTFSLSDASNP